MRLAPGATLLIAAFSGGLFAQSFEVASVKLNTDPAVKYDKNVIRPSPGGLNLNRVTLLACIEWAYEVKEEQVSGPSWLDSQEYDIEAKAPGEATPAQLRVMLQGLLAERFKLSLRRERKEIPVYVLALVKSGESRLAESKGAEPRAFTISQGTLMFRNYSLDEWAEWASITRPFGLDRPVVNQTGMAGRYDFDIRIAGNMSEFKRTFGEMKEQVPDLYDAGLRTLGLKLASRKMPLEFLEIDHVEKVPVGN